MAADLEFLTVDLWVYTAGSQHDEAVDEAVGRPSNGGGVDLQTGERDLSYGFGVDETTALGEAVVKLAKLPFVTKVEVH